MSPTDLRHFGLQEQRRPVRIEAQGQQVQRRVANEASQCLGIAERGQGVQVGNEVKRRIGPVLQVDVLADGAKVVAPVKTAGRLDAGKNAWHGLYSS